MFSIRFKCVSQNRNKPKKLTNIFSIDKIVILYKLTTVMRLKYLKYFFIGP
jgi:hypothetical protein